MRFVALVHLLTKHASDRVWKGGTVALRWVILVGGLGVGPWSWPISPWVRTTMDRGLELVLLISH